MRRRARVASVLILATMALVASEAGCGDIGPDTYPQEAHIAGSQAADDTGCADILACQEGGGGAGGQPPPPPDCIPGEGLGWEASETCGVFVRIDGDDENAGTPDAPVKSLGKAIALATARTDPKTKNVYVCAEAFTEKVEIQADVTLFGGLECENGWRWIGEQKRTTLTAEAGTIPLTMHGGGSVRMEDIDVLASSIPQDDSALFGASSIAAVAEGVTVSLARCTIAAGDAAPGANPRQDTNSATRGGDGNPGEAGCIAAVTAGGAEQLNDCEDDVGDSLGGAGGVGQTSNGGNGGNGGDGIPDGSANGGPGQTTGGTSCMNGRDGAPGASGEPGAGAMARGTRTQGGYTGISGDPGLPGITAQGGGGGGGARGVPSSGSSGRSCPDPSAKGASGGSGGAGGCGGKGGPGGSAGGASIALINLDSTLQLHDVTLKTGRGGKGGNGAPGQRGGDGGAGGVGGEAPPDSSDLNNACNGGRGGQGGQGGRGGGGRGGHSIGIAFHGTPPMDANDLHFELGEPGIGGEGDGNSGDGAPGAKEPTLDFSSP